ncbi:hypothetical protein Acor_74660 [Acrocarpospora corrugata]|uniref:Uncharacterized protein n=1 Tax=Acrocarpospora corrugata TaxID=35763 RepID=A0A5M3WG79_9ACTN|nr:hypothetical protein Acor_74660 [Acrocarpospora corrugata]
MEQGPPLSEINLRIGGSDIRGLASDTDSHDWDGRERRFTPVLPGKQIDLVVQMEYEGPSRFELELTLECTEEGGHARSWTIRRMITASETSQSDSGLLPSWARRPR